MAGQTERLKNYTEKMSSIHRLEDIIPDIKPISLDTLCSQIRESGVLLCGEFTSSVLRYGVVGAYELLLYKNQTEKVLISDAC